MKVFTTPLAPSTRGRERATSRTPSHSGVNMEQVSNARSSSSIACAMRARPAPSPNQVAPFPLMMASAARRTPVSIRLRSASVRRRPIWRATPGYAPGDLLKLYIYGYLNRVRSSRRLEREAQRNIEVIWLVRGLKPDFKTIADFRRDNRGAFKSVFRQFVLLCRRLDLYGRELLAVDGTRIKAVNNKDRNFTRASLRAFIRTADERLNEYLERLDYGDVEDGATSGGARTKNLAEKIAALGEKRGRYQAMLAQLERTDEAQISLTEP